MRGVESLRPPTRTSIVGTERLPARATSALPSSSSIHANGRSQTNASIAGHFQWPSSSHRLLEADHGQRRQPQERREELGRVILPGRAPDELEQLPEPVQMLRNVTGEPDARVADRRLLKTGCGRLGESRERTGIRLRRHRRAGAGVDHLLRRTRAEPQPWRRSPPHGPLSPPVLPQLPLDLLRLGPRPAGPSPARIRTSPQPCLASPGLEVLTE